jgi:hypothetical protein
MLAESIPCPEMRRLMLEYAEVALAHCDLTRGYRQTQRSPETENHIEQAELARQTAWLAWEKHVSWHGCELAQTVTI